MAHIPDGILALPVVAVGAVAAAACVASGLRGLDERRIPQVAILAAAFFVGSLIVIPVGPSSVHPLLAALMGLTIGAHAFPAILVGIMLQAALFGFGGLTTLGVNTVNIALPGVVLGLLLSPTVARAAPAGAAWLAGSCAALSVAGTAGLVALCLVLSGSEYVPSAKILVATYVPLMLGEGIITAFAVAFLKRVRPDFLAGRTLVSG